MCYFPIVCTLNIRIHYTQVNLSLFSLESVLFLIHNAAKLRSIMEVNSEQDLLMRCIRQLLLESILTLDANFFLKTQSQP